MDCFITLGTYSATVGRPARVEIFRCITHYMKLHMCNTCNYASVSGATETYGSCCVCVLVIPRDSCLHFLHNRWKIRTETCNASLTQYYLEIKLVNFGLVALLSSYGVICCSPWRLLPAIQSQAKNKSPTTGCLSKWHFNLYNKPDGDQMKSRERDCQSYTA